MLPTKSSLRLEARRRRAALGASQRQAAALAIAAHVLALPGLTRDDLVASYWPLRDELDTQPLMAALHGSGHGLALPVVIGPDQPLQFRLWQPGAPLHPAGFGALAPGPEAPSVTPTLILLPLLGFDDHGTRLGYGGGYYDRTLAALPASVRRIGLGFAAQKFASLPREDHDLPLEGIVTEAGFFSLPILDPVHASVVSG